MNCEQIVPGEYEIWSKQQSQRKRRRLLFSDLILYFQFDEISIKKLFTILYNVTIGLNLIYFKFLHCLRYYVIKYLFLLRASASSDP